MDQAEFWPPIATKTMPGTPSHAGRSAGHQRGRPVLPVQGLLATDLAPEERSENPSKSRSWVWSDAQVASSIFFKESPSIFLSGKPKEIIRD